MIELSPHDHSFCVERVLSDAKAICAEKGVRLTDQRQSVLRILAASHVPSSAYDILNQLNKERKEKGEAMLAPVSIYRALDFLLQHGIIHRIESRNAYVACNESPNGHHSHDEATIFLLCDQCGRAAEFQSKSLGGLIETIAGKAHFSPNAPVMEIRGLCEECQKLQNDA